MVSQADRELINNFVNELRPYLETVESGVHEFAQPNRDGVIVGQAVQALMMVRGAGQILMVDGLVAITSWLVESFEKVQNNPDIAPAEATRRLTGLFSAMEDFLVALDHGDDGDAIVLRAKTIFEAIPAFGGPLPGTGRLRPRTDLDALFGDEQSTAPTDRIGGGKEAADTERLAARPSVSPNDQTAGIPEALPTVPLQRLEAATRRVTDQPARIVPVPPQPTEELPTVDPELREIFEEEALGIVAAFGDGIRELARNPSDQQAIHNLNRAAHTLKGAANMTGFTLIAQIGAAIETLFDVHMEHGMTVSRDVLELVAVSWKMLRAMIPKLNDLASFTSPSNSIIQRANVLREELTQALAEAETISIDHQRYEEPIEEPVAPSVEEVADKPTDEIVSINIQMPAPTYQYVEVDALMVEAAPTVPLNRDAVTPMPVAPLPVEEDAPVDEPEAIEPHDDLVETAQSDAAPTVVEDMIEPGAPTPLWAVDDTVVEDVEEVVETVEPPQSEPFWTPGTEELMRSAVHTDRLIADLYDIPDFDEDVIEDPPVSPVDEFFTGIDADESAMPEENDFDDGNWLDESDRPVTDLLNFDAAPRTEPFWSDLDSPRPESIDPPELDEPITMDPFFEPVEGGTTFMRAAGLADPVTDSPEFEAIDESTFEEDWLASGADAAADEAAPEDTSTARLVAPEVDETEPEPAGFDDEPVVHQVVRSTPDVVVAPAFESDLAEILASTALDRPHFTIPIVEVDAEDAVIEEQPQRAAPHVGVAYWWNLDEVFPTDFEDQSADQTVVEFDAIDHDADAEMLSALDARREAVEKPIDAESEVDSVVYGPEFVADIEEFNDDVVIETHREIEEFWTPEYKLIDVKENADEPVDEVEPVETIDAGENYELPDLVAEAEVSEFYEDAEPATGYEIDSEAVVNVAADVESSESEQAGHDDGLLIDFDEESLFDLDSVVAGIDAGELGNLDWFEGPAQLDSEPAPDPGTEEAAPTAIEQEAMPSGTGFLSGQSGTGLLRGPATDALGFGSLDLARFMTPEGSMALSSALLDMALAGQEDANGYYGETGPSTVSVFDESSDRALEIEMFETFALEAEDHLATLNRAAMQLDRDALAVEPLIDIKRALHTIKGAAAAADFSPVSNLAHELEDSLAAHERFGTLADGTFTSSLFSAIEDIEARLAQRKDEIFGKSESEQERSTLRVDVSSVDNLLNTVGELVVNRSSFEERLERLGAMIEDLSTASKRLQRSSYMLEREANAENAIGRLLRGEMSYRENGYIPSTHNEWDTLEMDRYTEFDRIVRQLAEVGADVATVVGEISSLRGDFDTVSTRQRRLTTALQDELMGIRMVPISSLAPRLYRVVRRAAGQRGKDVTLVFEGGDTPFDKILLDTLSESLLHLLRNAVDHGIEEISERRRIGKPEYGTIRVRAFRDGSEAVIEIIDDGAGIDHLSVIEHARAKGMSVPDNMTREDALSLIFAPGFSTRDEADDISGRGLGLEIVEQTVARYKGRVAVDSVAGRGTIFSLRLPVMLSVIQAFLVRAGSGDFAIPVANVDYVVDRIDQPLTQIGESIVIETAGQIIPVVDLGMRLGNSRVAVIEKEAGWIMVTEIAGKRWALVVDELHGQQEIVVKPMGRFLRAMPSLMGATILGHGDVALIVDVPALLGVDSLVTRLDAIPAIGGKAPKRGMRTPDPIIRDDGNTRVVLVVDDSLSVRRVVSRTFERHGWVALLARDGAEALEILEQSLVDVVLTDLEMPRMDGFELISAIRGGEDLHDLPIAVLTSRSGDKHRERALALGANEYLVKPFQEGDLIDIVEKSCRVSSRV